MFFSIVDYVVLGILFIFCIIGLFRGFIKTLFSLCKGVLTFGGAYLLCGPSASFIMGTGIINPINSKISSWIVSKNAIFNEKVSEESASLIIEHLNLPSFVNNYVVSLLENHMEEYLNQNFSLADVVAKSLTNYIIMSICFFLLLVILSLLIRFIFALIERLFEGTGLNSINRIFGFVFGAVLGYVFISIIFFILALSSGLIPPVNDLIQNQIDPTNSSFGLSRYLYNNNFLSYILEKLLFKS